MPEISFQHTMFFVGGNGHAAVQLRPGPPTHWLDVHTIWPSSWGERYRVMPDVRFQSESTRAAPGTMTVTLGAPGTPPTTVAVVGAHDARSIGALRYDPHGESRLELDTTALVAAGKWNISGARSRSEQSEIQRVYNAHVSGFRNFGEKLTLRQVPPAEFKQAFYRNNCSAP